MRGCWKVESLWRLFYFDLKQPASSLVILQIQRFHTCRVLHQTLKHVGWSLLHLYTRYQDENHLCRNLHCVLTWISPSNSEEPHHVPAPQDGLECPGSQNHLNNVIKVCYVNIIPFFVH